MLKASLGNMISKSWKLRCAAGFVEMKKYREAGKWNTVGGGRENSIDRQKKNEDEKMRGNRILFMAHWALSKLNSDAFHF